MTQEELFGFGFYFAMGKRLPNEKGDLKDFKIIRMSAVKGEDYYKFEGRLIKKLGDTPKRDREIRARQLHALIEKYTGVGKIFIIIVNNAHLLNIKMLLCFKSFHESKNAEFVLLGTTEKIKEIIEKDDGIRLRMVSIPGN